MKNGVLTRDIPEIEIIGALLAIVAAAATLLLLASLHILSPEFDPSFRMVSEYALGHYGWVLSLMFLAWGMSSWALAVAIWSQVNTFAGKVGWWFLVIAGIGEAMASVFDVTHDPGHSIAGVLGLGGIVAECQPWPPARMAQREIAAPLDCEPELDKRCPVGGNIGSDDGSIRPGNWRPLASARTDATSSRSARIRWMGRQADRPLQLLVGVGCCEACDEVGRPKGDK